MDQRQLINRCQLGDLDSFEELYKLYKQKALGTAYLIGGNSGVAEDIVQEAFVICYHQIKHLKNPDVFNIWFYRILIRAGWRLTAKNKHHVSFNSVNIDPEDNTGGYFSVNSSADLINDRILVREAIRKLAAPLKTVIILYYFNEPSIKEISNITDCFQGTVKSRLYKARKILGKELGASFTNEYGTEFCGKEIKVNE